MSRKWFLIVLLLLAIVFFPRARADQAHAPVKGWLPDDSLIIVEVTQPKLIFDWAFSAKVSAAVLSSKAYQQLAEQRQFRPLEAVTTYLETALGVPWKDLLRRIAGEGVTFALLRDGSPLLVLDTADEKLTEQLNNTLLGLIRADAKGKGAADPVTSKSYRGVTAYGLGGKVFYAVAGRQVLIAPKDTVLRTALDARASGAKKSMEKLAAYRQACDAAGSQAAARAFVNFDVLKQTPKIQAALKSDLNPAGALLISGLIEPLRASKWLAAGLDVRGDSLTLRVLCDGKVSESKAAAFAWPAAGSGALPTLSVPRMVATGTLHRDLHGYYSAKDKLFPERSSGLVFFENMLEIAFSGRETPENILGETKPGIRFVVARQQYPAGSVPPSVQAPAFAVVLPLKRPQDFSENLEEGWQKMIGLTNVTRGQKALPGLIFDRRRHNDVDFAIARFGKPKAEELKELPVRFNFSPALAIVGEHAVLSSTEGLARDLIDALKQESAGAKPLAETSALLEIDGTQLTTLLTANRNAIAAENMIKQGISLEEALGKLDAILAAIGQAERARLSVVTNEGRPNIALELKLK